jgi:predicted regulator of Ras-like GTPase activity (Roadblock/LC7/MglB family)
MSFDSILEQVLSECPGALAATLMGNDGLAIAQAVAPGATDLLDELSTLGVEFGRILDEARKASDAAGAGATHELSVRTDRFHVLLHAVDRETYLVLALAPEGNVGKGRYLLRRQLLAVRQEL